MSVVCAACQTENRDSAKFCHGCTAKLPAFYATGPSALDAMKTWRPPAAQRPAARPAALPLPGDSAAFWIRVGLLVLGCALGLVGWYAYVTRKPASLSSVPPRPAVIATATAAAAPQPRAMEARPKDAQSVPVLSSLAIGEMAVASGPEPEPAPAATPKTEPAPERASVQRAARPSQRIATLDPRQGCEKLNFFMAARCEAANCDKPPFARHPRCDAVREDRKRDEARRNPTLGF